MFDPNAPAPEGISESTMTFIRYRLAQEAAEQERQRQSVKEPFDITLDYIKAGSLIVHRKVLSGVVPTGKTGFCTEFREFELRKNEEWEDVEYNCKLLEEFRCGRGPGPDWVRVVRMFVPEALAPRYNIHDVRIGKDCQWLLGKPSPDPMNGAHDPPSEETFNEWVRLGMDVPCTVFLEHLASSVVFSFWDRINKGQQLTIWIERLVEPEEPETGRSD